MQETREREIEPAVEQAIGGGDSPQSDPVLDGVAELEIDPEDLQPRAWVRPKRSRVLLAIGILVVMLMMAVLPPYISVNRYRAKIAQSISASLGRPVHMGKVTLNVLPAPGLTLENFVVMEDLAFGSEPVIQARSVTARLRVLSLWRRRVEFSRISLDSPSVNLVRRADGRWNIESILLRASKIEAAPTAQKGAGDEPRFPYIEATDARVNVKMGLEKMPLALTEAEFALWLPQPQQWRLRLEGRPARTDTAATDTGTLRVQGTLGKAATMKDVPLDLTAEWRAAPLGGVSWVLIGRDAGFRGDMTLRTSVQGTVGQNAIESRLQLSGVRRADFVPARTLDADVTCRAEASAIFHRLSKVRCGWPSGVLGSDAARGLALTAELPVAFQLRTAIAAASLKDVPAAGLLDALRLESRRVSPELTAGGAISGTFACCGDGGLKSWSGSFSIGRARLAVGDAKAFLAEDVDGDLAAGELTVRPMKLDLGAPQPALLEARIDRNGYAMHLSGPGIRTRLMQFAEALPQFGDGLGEVLPINADPVAADGPIRVDLVSSRTWAAGQTWSVVAAKPVKARKRSRE